MKNEPVVIYGTLGTLIGAVLAGLLRNYTDMPDDLTAAIVELVVFMTPVLIGLFFARGMVDGPETVKKKEDTHRMAEANKAFAHFGW